MQVRPRGLHRALFRPGHPVHQQPLEYQPEELVRSVLSCFGDLHVPACVWQHRRLCGTRSIRSVTLRRRALTHWRRRRRARLRGKHARAHNVRREREPKSLLRKRPQCMDPGERWTA